MNTLQLLLILFDRGNDHSTEKDRMIFGWKNLKSKTKSLAKETGKNKQSGKL